MEWMGRELKFHQKLQNHQTGKTRQHNSTSLRRTMVRKLHHLTDLACKKLSAQP